MRVIQQIQALTLELHELQQREDGSPDELNAKRRTLEQLRRRLAVVARRDATDGLRAAP